jgi:cytidylate kinase|tara:strand:+ start:3210 stop:3860 length:651 start_codon:yes stop_codon:yes gene_type:complete
MIIAIDGPAGSGKSTTAKLLAEKLKFVYLDTGSMYRAVTLFLLDNKVDYSVEKNIQTILEDLKIDIEYNTGVFSVFLNKKNVSDLIRNARIDSSVSKISKIKAVRVKMIDIQRSFSKNQNIVIEGRDIASNVFPNADYKFFIKADIKIRAKRRLVQSSTNKSITLTQMIKEIKKRDEIDSNRLVAPLLKVDGAIEIDTTNLSIEDQVHKIYKIINN